MEEKKNSRLMIKINHLRVILKIFLFEIGEHRNELSEIVQKNKQTNECG